MESLVRRFIDEVNRVEPAPMSQPNRLIAYLAANKLRELGYEWDGKDWTKSVSDSASVFGPPPWEAS